MPLSLRASGRKLEKFTVSVNVAAGSKVTFELTYEELLKRNKGKYEMYLKVQPKQLVRHFEVSSHSCIPCSEPQRAGGGKGGRGEVRDGEQVSELSQRHISKSLGLAEEVWKQHTGFSYNSWEPRGGVFSTGGP